MSRYDRFQNYTDPYEVEVQEGYFYTPYSSHQYDEHGKESEHRACKEYESKYLK